jgi:hypothetical protein
MLIYNMAISATANLGPVTTIANIGQPASLAERAVKARSGRFDPDQYPSHRHFSQLLRKLDLCGSYSQTQPDQAVHVQRLVHPPHARAQLDAQGQRPLVEQVLVDARAIGPANEFVDTAR